MSPDDKKLEIETDEDKQLKELKTGKQIVAALPNLTRNQLSTLYQQWYPMIQLIKQITTRAKPKLEDTSANFSFQNWIKQLNPVHDVSNFDRIQLRRAYTAGYEAQIRVQQLGTKIVEENESLMTKVTELQIKIDQLHMKLKVRTGEHNQELKEEDSKA